MRCVSLGVTIHRKVVSSRLLDAKDKMSLAKRPRQTKEQTAFFLWLTTGKWDLNHLPQPISKECKE